MSGPLRWVCIRAGCGKDTVGSDSPLCADHVKPVDVGGVPVYPGPHQADVAVNSDEVQRRMIASVPDPFVAGRKDDSGKARYSLLPWRGLDEVVAVLEHGARKYGEGNWRKVPDARRRYLDAALRHIRAEFRGDPCDGESGAPHLAHAVCSLLFVLELDAETNEQIANLHRLPEATP